MQENDFYIGWQVAAPKKFVSHIKKWLLILLVLIFSAATLLALQQRKFSRAVFEYGNPVEVEGIYQNFPIPSLLVSIPGKSDKSQFLTIPLVGYGKSGADGIIRSIENRENLMLDGLRVKLAGTLIYYQGKTILQIDGNDKPLRNVLHGSVFHSKNFVKEYGTVSLEGEILDPKCYFGVMKPGSGKPHRDCAIRCIEGGINPVFHVQDESGESDYCILVDSLGNKINHQVKDWVAEPVILKARAVQYNDWKILYIEPASIRRVGKLTWSKNGRGIVSCGK